MSTCPKCGREVPDGSAFCPYCGNNMKMASAANAAPQQPAAPAQPSVCPSCGKPLSPGAKFCPYCGTVLQGPGAKAGAAEAAGTTDTGASPAGNGNAFTNAVNNAFQAAGGTTANAYTSAGTAYSAAKPAPAGKKPGKKILIPVAIAGGAAAVAVIAGAAVYNSPENRFLRYQADFVKEKFLDPAEDTLKVYSKGLSTDLTLTGSIDMGSDNPDMSSINSLLEDSSVTLKIDADKKSAVIGAALNLSGSDVLTGTYYVDEKAVGFQVPELDDTIYEADLEDMRKELGFDDVELKYLIPDEKTAKRLLLRYGKIAKEILNKDSLEVSKEKDYELPYLDEEEDLTVYTFTPDSGDIEDALKKMAKELKDDKDVENICKDWSALLDLLSEAESSGALSSILYDIGIYPDDLDVARSYLDEGPDELADLLKENAGDIGDAVEESGFTWILGVKGNEVRYISFNVDGGSLVYEGTKDGKDRTDVYYVFSDYGDDGSIAEDSVGIRDDYTDGKKREGALSFLDYGDTDFTVKYEIMPGTRSEIGVPYGTYELNASGSIGTLEVGKGESGTDHTFTMDVENGFYGYDYYGIQSVTINLNSSSKSTAKKPKGDTEEISDWDASDYEQLFTEWGPELENLLENLTENNSAIEDFLYGLF